MVAKALDAASVQLVMPRQPVIVGSEWLASGASTARATPYLAMFGSA